MSRFPLLRSLFGELKRRHVLRVALVYLVSAWAIVQVLDIVVPRLQLPDALVTGLIVVLACGFPIALVLAWALELTPEGQIVRAPPADGRIAVPAHGRRMRFAVPASAACALALAAIGAATHRLPWPRSTDVRSIAVLPFVHMSAAPDAEYLGDGIAEELLDALAAIRGLDVVARTSSFQFKDTTMDVRDIGRRLGVEAVLEGSVRRSGDRLRIAAQLISTATGYHLWSGTFDRGPVEVFQLQGEIAVAIADTIELRFLARGARPARRPTSAEAVDLYWKGLHSVGLGSRAGLLEGIDQLRSATSADPALARAHSTLSLALIAAVERGVLDEAAALEQARTNGERALALDEGLADGHAARGYLLARGNHAPLAEEAFRRALVFNPSHVPALRWYRRLLEDQDRTEEAEELRRRASRLDPLPKSD